MDTNGPIRKWSQLRNIKVRIPSAGITVGIVEDFYFKPESTGVDGLLVKTRLGETFLLPISKIHHFEGDAVTIDSEQMLGRRLSPYPLGSSLIGNVVQDEKGKDIGTISDILVSVEPAITMRVTSFELKGNGREQGKTFSADAIIHYKNQQFTLQDQFARKLK